MPPKKGKKMALNDFLVDETLGSWADEMDSLPTAPTLKTDEERYKDRDSRRDFSRGDRDFAPRERDFPPREELPLPTKPPYIAFVGNLSFDAYEDTIAEFFAPIEVKEVKIIKDRDEKPKGFGYVEFETLDGLKDALTRSGGQMASRTVRISVAEPPKERSGGFDDDRFAGPWRREGPLPPLSSASSRGPSGDRDRYGTGFSPRASAGEIPPPSAAEGNIDWRSNRTARLPPPPPTERPGPPSRRSSVAPSEVSSHPAHTEQAWSIGAKFKPAAPVPENSAQGPQERKSLFGGKRGDGVEGTSGSKPDEDHDWRSAPRRNVSGPPSNRGSPTTSTPPTPQLGRRKLELLPRSGAGSATPGVESPLGSPKSANASSAKASPFGAARPIDVAAKEKEVEERLEQERLARAAALAKEKESTPAFGNRSSFSRGTPSSKSATPTSPSHLPTESTAPAPAADSKVEKAPAPRREFSAGTGVIKPQLSFAAAAAAREAAAAQAAAAQASAANPKPEPSGVAANESQPVETSEASVEKLAEDVAATL